MMQVVVQASSRAWSGAKDMCMNLVNGKPVVAHTVEKFLKNFPQCNLIIGAPDFDRHGELSNIFEMYPQVKIYFGENESPLNRMRSIHRIFFNSDRFIRINGLNLFFHPKMISKMWSEANTELLDCMMFPDNYPTQFNADIYNINALKILHQEITMQSPFQVHPKYALFRNKCFRTRYFVPRSLSDTELREARKLAEQVYVEPRDEIVETTKIKGGDTLSFHYEIALEYIQSHHHVLDIACGGHAGPNILAQKNCQITAADLDALCIALAKKYNPSQNINFCVQNATETTFNDETFDVITSFETIEHVNCDKYLHEMHRILKKDGKLILSTPQNALGHIPVNPQHHIEFSLEGIISLCARFFEIEKIIGIKQGCIYFDDSPIGSNTILFLRKRLS